jgi:hypothetical protein
MVDDLCAVKKRIKSTETKSRGTVISEKARAIGNTHGDEKRASLIEQGMAIIYGQSGHAKCATNRR